MTVRARKPRPPRDWAWLAIVAACEAGLSSRSLRAFGEAIEAAAAERPKRRSRRP